MHILTISQKEHANICRRRWDCQCLLGAYTPLLWCMTLAEAMQQFDSYAASNNLAICSEDKM